MEKIKCNDHEIKYVEGFKYLGSKTVIHGRLKKKLQKIQVQAMFTN
jgi:hypothetical protein